MDYHFVGDVVAGGFVGGIVGTYTAYCTGLAGPRSSAPVAVGNPGSPTGERGKMETPKESC
jgi:hypothetical protein